MSMAGEKNGDISVEMCSSGMVASQHAPIFSQILDWRQHLSFKSFFSLDGS